MKTWLVCRLLVAVATLAASVAGGAEPVVIATAQGSAEPKQPQIAIGTHGEVHLVYGEDKFVRYCRSSDGGLTFSPPQAAFACPKMALGMRRGPRIATAGETIVVTAIGGAHGGRRDGDLQAWRSADGGKSWQSGVVVNDEPGSAREGLHGMCAAPDASLWCVWLDLRGGRTEVYAARSVDGGAQWGRNLLVYRSPDGSVCECCHPSVAVDRAGRVSVLFRNSLGGSRDMYLSTSSDGGQSFSEAKKLGTGTWKLKACPMDGGMLAVDAQRAISTVWRRETNVYSMLGGSAKEELLGRGQQPWMAATRQGFVAVWTAGREGNLWLKTPSSAEPISVAASARDPVVVSDREDAAIIAWQGKHDGRAAIFALRVPADQKDR